MRIVLRNAPAALLAAGAGALWAVGLTVLQPLGEPPPGGYAENNTNWARDLRWMAIAAIVLAAVLAARGDRRVTAAAVLAGLAWTGADLGLDRADLTGGTVVLAPVAAAVAAAGCLLAGLLTRAPRRQDLIVAGGAAAVLSSVAGLLESPTDQEWQLDPATLAACALLGLLAVGCAAAASATPGPRRATLAAVPGVAAVVGAALLRAAGPGQRVLPLMVYGALLLTAVAWRRPAPPALAGVAVGGLLAHPFVLFPLHLVLAYLLPVAGVFTELAGSPPVNGADTDAIVALPTLAAGLILGVALARLEPGRRPEPAAGPVPVALG
jgi:hypothetical protein